MGVAYIHMNPTNSSAVLPLRLALPSVGPDPKDLLDARFGRCRWILLHTPGTGEWEALERDPDAFESGAGRAAAGLLARHGVTVLLAGKVGPKAATALREAGIEACEDLEGPCAEVVTAWLASMGKP